MSDGQLSFRKSANIDRVTDKRKDSLFRLVDTDGSGTIDAQEFAVLYDAIKKDLAEELEKEAALQKEASSARRRFKMLLLFVAVLVSFLAASVAANFAVIFTVVDQAITTTTTSTGLLEVKGSNAIAKTATATQDVPLIVAPALDLDTLAQVKSLRVTYQDTYTPVEAYSQEVQVSASVVAVRKHNATFVEFVTDVAGDTIEVLNGHASYVRYPTEANSLEQPLKFQICEANATCSAFRTSGIDVDAATELAKDALVKAGFADASRRLSLSWTCDGPGSWTMIDFCGLSYAPPSYNTDLGACDSSDIDKVGGFFYTSYPASRSVVLMFHGKGGSGQGIWPMFCNGGDPTNPFDCPMLYISQFRNLFFTLLDSNIVDVGTTTFSGSVGWSTKVEESLYDTGVTALEDVLCGGTDFDSCDWDAGYIGAWVASSPKVLALGFSDGAGFALYLNYWYDSVVTHAVCADYWAHGGYDTWLQGSGLLSYSASEPPKLKAKIYTHCASFTYADGLAMFSETGVGTKTRSRGFMSALGGPMTIPYAAGLGWAPSSIANTNEVYGPNSLPVPYKEYSWGSWCGAYVSWAAFGLPTSSFGPFAGGNSDWSSSCTYNPADWPAGFHTGMGYATPWKADIMAFKNQGGYYAKLCENKKKNTKKKTSWFGRRLEEEKLSIAEAAAERRELRKSDAAPDLEAVSLKASPEKFREKIPAVPVKKYIEVDLTTNKMDYTAEAKSAMAGLQLTPPGAFTVVPYEMLQKLKTKMDSK